MVRSVELLKININFMQYCMQSLYIQVYSNYNYEDMKFKLKYSKYNCKLIVFFKFILSYVFATNFYLMG